MEEENDPGRLLQRYRALDEVERAASERMATIKDGDDKRHVENLIRRAFHPECEWDREHCTDLLTLALKPDLVGWRFRILERVHQLFHGD